MWKKVKCCCEWDMAWFCSKCEKMMYWKTKGWNNPKVSPYNFYCNECKEKLKKQDINKIVIHYYLFSLDFVSLK